MTISTNTPARVVVLLTAVALALLLLLVGTVAANTGGDQAPNAAPVAHTVRTGETLWDIAADHTPAGDDVRDTIHDIRRLSGLEGSLIFPGQALTVPASG